jgi:cell division protein FtsL
MDSQLVGNVFLTHQNFVLGSRYDPDSIFFNKKCICEENWSGELCHIPIANQCKERGQYINGRCVCHGFYFGPKCQYVGKCVKGKLQEGLCHCEYGYEGDYCDQIVCHHGYPDKANDSKSCVCPDRHTGFFCDECLNQDPHILPFPNCTLQIRPSKAKMSREKTDQLIMKRILVIFIVLSILVILLIMISAHKWSRTRAEKSDSEIQHKESNAERQRMLLKQTVFRQNSRR